MTDTATETRRMIDAVAIALDETEYYQIDPEDAPYIRRILGGYVFDRNLHTHCCELTPSYFLIFLFTSVELTDAGLALDDDARGEIYDKYEYEGGDDCYMHVHTVDAIIAKAEPYTVCEYGDVTGHQLEDDIADVDERHDAELEAIHEDLCANHPF
jgi:hypothetical protein